MPQQLDLANRGSEVPIRVTFSAPQEPLQKELKMRRLYINQKMLEENGYTEECDGCRFKKARFSEVRNHSEVVLGEDHRSNGRKDGEARERQVEPTRSRHGGSR